MSDFSPLTRTQQLEVLERIVSDLGTKPIPRFQECASLFHNRRLEKGEYFVHAGNVCDSVALVNSGVARLFYTREDGREFNKGFVVAPDFMAALDALITQEPARSSIQAVTPMQLLVAPYAALAAFFERDVYWQRVQRRLVEQVYVKKVRREASLLMESAERRLTDFVREYPDVFEVVPDYQVAAYLGITPEALSRLKRADRVRS